MDEACPTILMDGFWDFKYMPVPVMQPVCCQHRGCGRELLCQDCTSGSNGRADNIDIGDLLPDLLSRPAFM